LASISAARSNIFTGSDVPSIDQWYTSLCVTIASVVGFAHFQKDTGDDTWHAFTR